jgi:AcrR family transcriptional regulator
VGRKAGVSAEETRAELLVAAARVFARKGYDGASVADICKEAGLSTGPVYAHYGSKAELFVAVLEEHGHEQFTRVVPRQGGGDVADFLATAGSMVDRRPPEMTKLVIEAIVASGRDPEVARLVRSWLTAGEDLLSAALRVALDSGAVGIDVEPETISRLVTIIGLGSYLTGALDVPPPDHDDWARLINRLVDVLRTG